MMRARRPRRSRPEDEAAAEVRAELDAHFEGSVSLLVSRGWTEAAARAEVRRRFGDERRYRDELERGARRRALRRRVLSGWHVCASAVRSGAREVWRSPGLSVALVATLALGLGANAAVFRVVDRLLLSPPPHIENASEVRRLHQTFRRGAGEPRSANAFTYADIHAMRTALPDVRFAASTSYVPETMGSGESAVRLRVGRVDAEYFPLLGVHPAVGRGLLPEDHRAGAAVAVLGDDTWRTHFGADPAVLGRRIRVARGDYEVVGIMPRGFYGAHAPATDLWIPLEAEAATWWGEDWRSNPNVLAFSVLARPERRTDPKLLAAQLEAVLRAADAGAATDVERVALTTSSLVPGSAPNPAATVSVSRWLAGVSLLVLLVACANAANLFLAHGERHRRETAVRMALGAGASALRVALLTRSLLLALLGAAGAALFAFWGGSVLQGLFLDGLELAARPATTRVLVFTGSLAIVAALLAGLLPALRAPRYDVHEALEGGGRVTGGTGAARRTLAAVQVALCMLLLVGAGLFVASFRNALAVDLGFAHDRLLMVRLEREDGVDISRAALYEAAVERVRALPTVVAASGTVAVPFTFLYGLRTSTADGEGIEDLHVNAVGPDFFRTMDVPVLRGRAFDLRDGRAGAEPVVIVSRRAAERLWPGRDALGECLRVGDETTACARVVGVAGDHAGVSFAPGELAPTSALQAWVPLGYPGALAASSLLVRTAEPPARALAEVRRAAAALPGVRFVEAELLSDIVGRELRSWRLGATVFSFFGVLALLVAGVGLYGVLAFEVAQRRRDFGIRLALGAGRLRVLVPLVRFAGPVVVIGLVSGAAVAIAAAARLGPLLFQVSPREPAVFLASAACVLTVTAAALLIPAWKAAGVDPRETLG